MSFQTCIQNHAEWVEQVSLKLKTKMPYAVEKAKALALYFEGAMKLLVSMEATDADWTLCSPAIFRRCTGAYHGEQHRHRYMQYGDYFFVDCVICFYQTSYRHLCL